MSAVIPVAALHDKKVAIQIKFESKTDDNGYSVPVSPEEVHKFLSAVAKIYNIIYLNEYKLIYNYSNNDDYAIFGHWQTCSNPFHTYHCSIGYFIRNGSECFQCAK